MFVHCTNSKLFFENLLELLLIMHFIMSRILLRICYGTKLIEWQGLNSLGLMLVKSMLLNSLIIPWNATFLGLKHLGEGRASIGLNEAYMHCTYTDKKCGVPKLIALSAVAGGGNTF